MSSPSPESFGGDRVVSPAEPTAESLGASEPGRSPIHAPASREETRDGQGTIPQGARCGAPPKHHSRSGDPSPRSAKTVAPPNGLALSEEPRPAIRNATPVACLRDGAGVSPEPNQLLKPIGDSHPENPPAVEPMLQPKPIDVAERRLADHLLALHADVLDDIEKARIAHENRMRSLLSQEDWGKGVNPALPEVQVLQGHLESLKALEHGAELALKRALRRHYLAAWVKNTVGVGEKQAGRLLASIGDPAWNSAEDRPRRGPAELWAFCGYRVLHPGQRRISDRQRHAEVGDSISDNVRLRQLPSDAQRLPARVDQPAAPNQLAPDTQNSSVGDRHTADQPLTDDLLQFVSGVAPKRQRGVKANWSTLAKTRTFLVAESCIKQMHSPYRAVYDAGRVKYAESVHDHPCLRCGPAGKPAQPGTPLSLGHQHARAMRLVSKAILRDLWREATKTLPPTS